MSNEDRKQKICEDLALLKVFKVMCQHDLEKLSNAQIYGMVHFRSFLLIDLPY